jgi:hypothetical protein
MRIIQDVTIKKKEKTMKEITDHWTDYYLSAIDSYYRTLTDDRKFTEKQKDRIKKKLQSMMSDFKEKIK